MSEKRSRRAPPRSSALSSAELAALALVAHPDAARAEFQRRGRWNRKKRRRGSRRAYFAFSAVDARRARAATQRRVVRQRLLRPRRGSRSAARSAGCASRLARKRTSSASTSVVDARRRWSSIVGTTTSVRDSAGCPCEKSIRGSGCGVDQQRGEPVDQRDRELAGRAQQREQRRRSTQHASRRAVGVRAASSAPATSAGEQRDRAEIERAADGARPTRRSASSRRRRALRRALELAAGPRRSGSSRRAPRASPAAPARAAASRELDRLARDLGLRTARCACAIVSIDVAVAVARGEIHRARRRRRILAQRLLDDAHRLDELAPVHRAEEAQAADAVADRDLVGGLLLGLRLHQLLDRQARLGEPLLDPGERQRQRRRSGPAGGARAPRRTSSSSAGSSAPCPRSPGSGSSDRCSAISIIWSAQSSAQVAVDACRRRCARPTRRRFSISARRSMIGMAHSSPSLQRRDRLVGGDEARAGFPGRPGRRRARSSRARCRRRAAARPTGPSRQPRQLAAVAFGQVPLGGADLLFDQVEVVEQPFAGRRDAAARRDAPRSAARRRRRSTLSFSASRASSRSGSARPGSARARRARRLAVLLHLVGAEQLRAQRRLVARCSLRFVGWPRRRAVNRRHASRKKSLRKFNSDFLDGRHAAVIPRLPQ